MQLLNIDEFSIIACWSLLFIMTKDIPILRSQINCIVCVVSALLGLIYFPFLLYGAKIALGYYFFDMIVILQENGWLCTKNVFLYHHILAFILIVDGIINGSIKYLESCAILGILFEISTVFLNWINMKAEKEKYKLFCPNFSEDSLRKTFAFSFLLFRVLLALPLTLLIMPLTPSFSRICHFIVTCLNLTWGSMILGKVIEYYQ